MAMELIKTVELATSTAFSFEFTSIPQDGVDLLIVLSARDTGAIVTANLNLRLNGVFTGYADIRLAGTGSSVFSSSSSGGVASIGYIPAGNSTADTFGNVEVYIANYTSSTAKSISTNSVTENNATEAWQTITASSSTVASGITSVRLSTGNANFVAGTTASLYKIS